MKTRLERYIAARIEDPALGHKEASEKAGYADGASQSAVEAYRFARLAKEEPRVADWLSEELERVEAEIKRKSHKAAVLRAKLRAVRVVTRF